MDRRALAAAGLALLVLALLLAAPLPAAAHGEETGVADIWRDYGALIILVATVLVGAGVAAWALLTPKAPGDEDEG